MKAKIFGKTDNFKEDGILFMGLEHLAYPVVRQGGETMACWAASMAWYGKAVRHLNYDMFQVAEMYTGSMAAPPDGQQIGGMGDTGRRRLFRDHKWRLNQTETGRDGMSMNLINMYLDSSPTIICYWDPKLGTTGGSHVNVIVAKVPFTESQFFIMDPDEPDFKVRNLQYYSEKSPLFHLASLKGIS